MEVVLFKIRPRADVDAAEYQATFERMLALVETIPGYVDFEGYASEDGTTELALARFESQEAIARWRDHPDHVRTRERGRLEFFDAYDITIATVHRHYDWAREPSAVIPADVRSS